jgi:NADH:ubiquinone oxidoreductase subunit C
LQPADSDKNESATAERKPSANAPPLTPAPSVVEAGPSVPAIRPTLASLDTSRTLDMADEIAGRFPSAKIDYARPRRIKVTVPSDKIRVVALYIRDTMGFDHLNVVGGTDYVQQSEFEVTYFVGSVSTPGQEDLVIQLAERVKREESPTVPSLVDVWTAAEYHEREAFEMLGIVFEGHPDLRRLLLPEDWNDIPPLRKDYVSPGR